MWKEETGLRRFALQDLARVTLPVVDLRGSSMPKKPLTVAIKKRSLAARLKRKLRAEGHVLRRDRHHPDRWLIINVQETLIATGPLEELGRAHGVLRKFERLEE